MTIESINEALAAHNPKIGWAQLGARAMFNPPTTYCNRPMCGVYASAAALAGATDSDLAAAVGDYLNDDGAALAEVFATGEAFAAVLADVVIAWRVDVSDGITWVRDPSVRPTVQTELTFEGSPVSPADYFAAGDAAGATAADLADALRDLVDGDSTMFDAIMSAV